MSRERELSGLDEGERGIREEVKAMRVGGH
jgi:hypothetical protein